MKKHILILFSVVLMSNLLQAQNTVSISINAEVEMYNGEPEEEWIHLKLTDSISSQVIYDSLLSIDATDVFITQLNLPNSLFKCEVLDISANVGMPQIKLANDSIVPWGYPEFNYYLFQLPVE